MGTVDELYPHQCVLCMEQICKDQVQGVPSQVVVAITSGSCKVGLRYPVLLEGGQHFGCILLRDGIDAVKLGTDISLGLSSQGFHFITYL